MKMVTHNNILKTYRNNPTTVTSKKHWNNVWKILSEYFEYKFIVSHF